MMIFFSRCPYCKKSVTRNQWEPDYWCYGCKKYVEDERETVHRRKENGYVTSYK